MTTVTIPAADGRTRQITMNAPAELAVSARPATSRTAYAAAHVVAQPWTASAEGGCVDIDWDATMAARRRLFALGLGVAESMDTAQRGMGLGWSEARELAGRTLREAAAHDGRVVVGVATDQLAADARPGLSEVIDAYVEQVASIEELGGRVVLMASRHLAAVAASPADYLRVYSSVIQQAQNPVVLHWLGEAFDPALRGYWGGTDLDVAADTVVDLIAAHHDRVEGIKMSLLDAGREVELRRRLPDGVKLFTGDDYSYVDLIAGDGERHSHALLGAFAAVAPFASAALARLDAGDEAGFREVLGPTQDLNRLIFTSPTRFYKTGIVWLAYLSGAQDHFRMIGGLESGRSLVHLAEVFRCANDLGAFPDPELAARRASATFGAHGVS
ncbi:Dihydrodipicolinate synthase/N-acetylneuraminate lyase [Klenkia soli]|uniref:Dihydrodipicolinate synthase/N-acetylneuraminate lyase n=1 Tax=Klenkia soli TaxID=1052260 RepID=A0A1H0G4K3_9ACTN|nr:dihydrodipicolinate synthase family protein [Klenkia soli]SDO01843.1 Dihydrodipicolinate synthase/N-acetylneuraminate lyase [Klenkia soli]